MMQPPITLLYHRLGFFLGTIPPRQYHGNMMNVPIMSPMNAAVGPADIDMNAFSNTAQYKVFQIKRVFWDRHLQYSGGRMKDRDVPCETEMERDIYRQSFNTVYCYNAIYVDQMSDTKLFKDFEFHDLCERDMVDWDMKDQPTEERVRVYQQPMDEGYDMERTIAMLKRKIDDAQQIASIKAQEERGLREIIKQLLAQQSVDDIPMAIKEQVEMLSLTKLMPTNYEPIKRIRRVEV